MGSQPWKQGPVSWFLVNPIAFFPRMDPECGMTSASNVRNFQSLAMAHRTGKAVQTLWLNQAGSKSDDPHLKLSCARSAQICEPWKLTIRCPLTTDQTGKSMCCQGAQSESNTEFHKYLRPDRRWYLVGHR